MKRVLILLGGIGLMTSLVVFPLMAAFGSPAPKPIVLKAVTGLPSDYIVFAKYRDWVEMVKQRSKGELIINTIGGPEAIPLMQQVEALKSGIVDINVTFGSWLAGAMPIGDAMALSSLTVKEERERGLHDWYRKVMAKEINAYYLGQYHAPQWMRLGTNKLARTRGDLARSKIRAISFIFPGLKAVGAVPVAMPMTDVYTAMERGVVDGWQMPYASNLVETGLAKVTKYVVGPRLLYGQNSSLIVNLDKWKSLPPELQKVMLDTVVENEEVWYQWWIDTGNKEEKKWQHAGIKFIEWSAADNEWLQKTFTNALWDWVIQKNPVYGPEFKALVTK